MSLLQCGRKPTGGLVPDCSLHGCCRLTLSSQIAAPARASCPTHLERAIIASGEDLVARHRQRAHCVSVPRQRLLPLHRLIEAEGEVR